MPNIRITDVHPFEASQRLHGRGTAEWWSALRVIIQARVVRDFMLANARKQRELFAAKRAGAA